MFQIITRLSVDECDRLHDFLRSLDWEPEFYRRNGKAIATKRRIRWFGLECEGNYQENPSFMFSDRTIEKTVSANSLRDRFYPTADSILCYEYPRSAGIARHSDGGFDREVVLVNLVDGDRLLDGRRDGYAIFHHGTKKYHLRDGEVIRFDSSIEHSVTPVRWLRYSIQLRVADCELAF